MKAMTAKEAMEMSEKNISINRKWNKDLDFALNVITDNACIGLSHAYFLSNGTGLISRDTSKKLTELGFKVQSYQDVPSDAWNGEFGCLVTW